MRLKSEGNESTGRPINSPTGTPDPQPDPAETDESNRRRIWRRERGGEAEREKGKGILLVGGGGGARGHGGRRGWGGGEEDAPPLPSQRRHRHRRRCAFRSGGLAAWLVWPQEVGRKERRESGGVGGQQVRAHRHKP